MADMIQKKILHILDERRDEMLYHVTALLVKSLPSIGIRPDAEDRAERHHRNMELTARRFHHIVQAGVGLDWSLVESEYEWAGRKLGSMGATWEYQQTLIDSYFAEALRVYDWNAEEHAALQEIAERFREVARAAYAGLVMA